MRKLSNSVRLAGNNTYSYVRPHIEFCTQAWNPYYAKDIDLLEKIQHRATKLVPELCNLPYVT